MRTQLIALGILVLAGANAGAQDRPFVFAHTDTAQAREQVRYILASICEIPVTLDIGTGTLTVGGTAVQRGMAQWIFGELDTATPATGKREYAVPGAANDVVQILRPRQIVTPQNQQEMVNAVRSITEMRLAAAYTPQRALIERGTQAQLQLTEWLVDEVDALTPASGTRATDYDDRSKIPKEFLATAVRVIALPATATPMEMQELINTVRSLSELQRVVAYTTHHAIMLRGTPLQVKLAEWLVAQLDLAPGAAGMRATIFEGDLAPPGRQAPAVRVFYLPAGETPEALQDAVNRIRRETKTPRVVGLTTHPAIALRGTDAQAAAAEQLLR
jgi:hypothetical protein